MNPANVFVVEDDPIVCGDIERTVAKLGFNVVGSADSGEKALHMINALKPDVVLMDISLKGGKDGVTTAAELKPVNDAAIIFLTAFFFLFYIEHA